jgi:tetratricopeptide (TPR) repeat protein
VVTLLLAALAFQPAPAMLRPLFEEQLARVSARYGPAGAQTAQAARDLGLFLAREGDAPAALAALSQAVRADETAFGASAPQTLADVAELAAVSEASQAAGLWRRVAGSVEAATAARALSALGDLREAAGDRTGAVQYYRRALEREEAVAGGAELRVAARLNTLALLLDSRAAVPLLERAHRIVAGRVGRRRIEAASIQINLATRLLALGRRDAAVRNAAEAVSIFEETLGPDHPRTVAARSFLADLAR